MYITYIRVHVLLERNLQLLQLLQVYAWRVCASYMCSHRGTEHTTASHDWTRTYARTAYIYGAARAVQQLSSEVGGVRRGCIIA